jgi:hypothetical protein
VGEISGWEVETEIREVEGEVETEIREVEREAETGEREVEKLTDKQKMMLYRH